MGKYQPLADHLAALADDEWRTSFAELETVLGFELPRSARDHAAWWGNERITSKPHKQAWIGCGWRTEGLDLGRQQVTFRRVGPQLVAAADGATPEVIQEAVAAYDRRKRAKRIGITALGGGAVAAAAGLVVGVVGFVLGRYLRRR